MKHVVAVAEASRQSYWEGQTDKKDGMPAVWLEAAAKSKTRQCSAVEACFSEIRGICYLFTVSADKTEKEEATRDDVSADI